MDLTAIIRKGERQYVALCPKLDVVSQGVTVEEALSNIKEAVELYIDEMGIPEGQGTRSGTEQIYQHSTVVFFQTILCFC